MKIRGFIGREIKNRIAVQERGRLQCRGGRIRRRTMRGLRVPYTQYGFLSSCMFLELFLFAKKMKFLTKGGIHCISRSSLGTLILCAGTHWSN